MVVYLNIALWVSYGAPVGIISFLCNYANNNYSQSFQYKPLIGLVWQMFDLLCSEVGEFRYNDAFKSQFYYGWDQYIMSAMTNQSATHRLHDVLSENRRQSRKNLVTFITAGDPNLAQTEKLMHTLVAAGVDVIELGVPFSDPMADGPVIQRASQRAVAQGVGLHDVLGLVKKFRQSNTKTPVVLMGYANPIEHFGQELFISAATQAGVDGALVVDYPPEESHEFAQKAQAAGLNIIYLVAPTTTDARIKATAAAASGFIYYVSLKGVTGAATLDVADVSAKVAHLRGFTDLPINVGFGISDAQSAKQVAQTADGVVIGSKIIQLIETAQAAQQDPSALVSEWVAGVRAALDEI